MRKRKRKSYIKKKEENVIDLHKTKHSEASIIIEDYVLLNKLPIKIITGNSDTMKNIVKSVLDQHGFKYRIGDMWNNGYIMVFS